ncbi:hypothetical protein KUTeg_001404 [Tegillarca granosa]|uniref:G-protein coupled receptors family 1 profile domain-containing protein n=1 Tax=Tegillarca granosa TaxID=220873 RepID=A0ABQ9FSZ8_TEGGR|nr:hypothetical protein KUTeg_001404 [Tegillarca granosa]
MCDIQRKLVPFFENAVTCASVLTILTITFDRYRVYFFIRMCRKLLKHMYFLETVNDNDSDSTVRGRRQVVFMLLMVVILFFVCVLPQRILGLWLIHASKEQLLSLTLEGYLNLVTFSRILLYMNSAMNPIIYSCVSTKFRQAFKEILTTKKTRPLKQVSSLTTRSRSSEHNRRRQTEETETIAIKKTEFDDKDNTQVQPFLAMVETEKKDKRNI